MSVAPVRVVLADDAPLLREGLARLLADLGFEVMAQVGDGDALLAAVASHRPDVAVVDIRMPPTHTVEGLVAGVVGGTFAFWFAGLYQDWFGGWDALAIGFLVAITAPLGDLFESAVKRDLEVKDTGRFFGAHGGVLDRLDAVFFTVVVAYYAAVALGYG